MCKQNPHRTNSRCGKPSKVQASQPQGDASVIKCQRLWQSQNATLQLYLEKPSGIIVKTRSRTTPRRIPGFCNRGQRLVPLATRCKCPRGVASPCRLKSPRRGVAAFANAANSASLAPLVCHCKQRDVFASSCGLNSPSRSFVAFANTAKTFTNAARATRPLDNACDFGNAKVQPLNYTWRSHLRNNNECEGSGVRSWE